MRRAIPSYALRGALLGEQLERPDEARLRAAARPPAAARRPARRSRAPSFIVITGSSIARQAACAGGNSTPSRASRSAGSTRRGQGSRPCSACSAPSPAGNPGTPKEAIADRVVDELGAERHLELEQLGPASRLGAEARHRDEAVEVPRAPGRLRRSGSRARRRAARSSPSRRRTTRGRRRPRRRPPTRRRRGSRLPPRRWRGVPAAIAARIDGILTAVNVVTRMKRARWLLRPCCWAYLAATGGSATAKRQLRVGFVTYSGTVPSKRTLDGADAAGFLQRTKARGPGPRRLRRAERRTRRRR